MLAVASGQAEDLQYPKQPPFAFGVCLLGKPFSGKQTLASILNSKYNLRVIKPEVLLQQALDAANAAAGAAKAAKDPKAKKDATGAAAPAAEVVYDEVYLTVGKKLQPLQAKGKGMLHF